jgi:hypothetical protein
MIKYIWKDLKATMLPIEKSNITGFWSNNP